MVLFYMSSIDVVDHVEDLKQFHSAENIRQDRLNIKDVYLSCR